MAQWLRLLSISWYRDARYRWLRWGRYVLHAKHASVPLLFSERQGYRRTLRLGQWRVGLQRDRTVSHG